MARIRTIKPEFWTNEKVMSCQPLTRLLFIGLWNFADDYGRMEFAPLSIKAKIFPIDSTTVADVRDMLAELSSNGLLVIYSTNDREYIEITGWDHQKIDKRQPSKIPGPFDDGSCVSTTPAELPRLPPTPAPVMEGNGGEGKEDIRSVAVATRPKVERWDEFKKEMPKRKGPNPWKPAFDIYERHVRNGVSEQTMIDGAKRLTAEHRRLGNYGTEFVVQAVTWLRQQRWGDTEPAAEIARVAASKVFVPEDHPAWPLWQAIKKTASTDGRDSTGRLCRGWHFDSEYPPSSEAA